MTITAKIIADSVNPDGVRITTLQLRYPKFCHNELMTHRVFSRNSSSSRAIPVERLIQDVLDDPVIPSFWGSNRREGAWLDARDRCIEAARAFAKAGYHKQIVNRLIEPWCHINTVITSTEWDNFFKLRCHPDAQPEMRMLAEAIRDAMTVSKPLPLNWGWWHLPYITPELFCVGDPNDIKSSVARCARVSYLTHDQKQTTVEEDLKLFERLTSADPKHLSPTEHQAQARNKYGEQFHEASGSNFHSSWLQYRKLVEQD